MIGGVVVGVACDSQEADPHPHSLSASLVAHHHEQVSRAELRQSRQASLSRSIDRRMVRYQRVEVQKEERREQLRLQRERQQRREAARRHRRAVERAQAAWRVPLSGYDITATFGQFSSLWSTSHTGVDLAADTGVPVTAVARGTVTFAAYDGAYGYKVVIRHEDGTETWYAHLNAISVSAGQRVANTTVIGSVGSTGNVTGSHLHLELRPGGEDPVDPIAGLAARGLRL